MKKRNIGIVLLLALVILAQCKPVLRLTFNEEKGNIVCDHSGNGNNGTILGDVIRTDEGVEDGAIELKANTAIQFQKGNIFNIKNEQSLSFWAKNTDRPYLPYRTIFCMKNEKNQTTNILIRIAWGYDNKYLFISRDNKSKTHDFYVCYTSGFGHYGIVFKYTKIWVYKDGELLEEWESERDLDLMSTDMTIQTYIGPMNGILDEFKIYNRALVPPQVKSLYQSISFSDYSNLLINSSFEETALPDFPDHWCSRMGFYPDTNKYSLSIDNEMAHTGIRCYSELGAI